MSRSDPISSIEELIKLECDKLKKVVAKREQNVQREKEKLERENELLKKEVKEHKIRVHDLEQTMLKAKATLASASSKPDLEVEPNNTLLKVKIKLSNPAGPIPLPNKDSTHQLTRCCDLKIIKKIKKILKKEDLEKFEQSCFGHMLKINALKFQEQLLLQLLVHMDMDASSNEKLVFKVNYSGTEFGPRDFSLITGLRLGTVEAPNITSSSLHEVVFKGKPAIFLKNIKKEFRRASRVDEGRDESALKLSLLYFLYGVLLGGDQMQKIDLKYLHLVEDLHKFNEFPWGQVAYEFLVSFMLSARKQMDCSKVNNKKPSLGFHGFVVALQIWAYEVMPSLAEYCAVRLSDSDNLTPRILQWSAPKKTICYEELKKFFEMDDKAHLVLKGVKASPKEMEELSNGSIPQHKRPKLVNEEDEMCDTESKANVAKLLEVEGRKICLSSATAGDVVIISDSDDNEVQNTRREDEGETKRKKVSNKREAADAVFRFSDSDDDSCSTTFMDNYVANLNR